VSEEAIALYQCNRNEVDHGVEVDKANEHREKNGSQDYGRRNVDEVSEDKHSYQNDDRVLTEWADTTHLGIAYRMFEEHVAWTIDYIEVYRGL